MNCQNVRKQITDSFAYGTASLAPQALAHRQACPSCQSFYEKQQELFQSLDAGLQGMVNQPVPPSLLPRVRARLDAAPVRRSSWNIKWGSAAVATVVLLAVFSAAVWHRLASQTKGTRTPVLVSSGESHLGTAKPATSNQGNLPAPRRRALAPSRREAPKPSQEVIISPEERAAFARFVTEVPEAGKVALALTRPAPAPDEAPVQIALLQIKDVEVKLLDGSTTE